MVKKSLEKGSVKRGNCLNGYDKVKHFDSYVLVAQPPSTTVFDLGNL